MTKKWRKHPPGWLMKTTLDLLAKTPRTQLEIYAATGIQPDWLTRFASGKITDPGVNRVETLYDFLNGQSLSVSVAVVKSLAGSL